MLLLWQLTQGAALAGGPGDYAPLGLGSRTQVIRPTSCSSYSWRMITLSGCWCFCSGI